MGKKTGCKGTSLEKEENNKFKLYVLRYNHSGNYYVGINENLEKRMLVHWRRESYKKGVPNWSIDNKSQKGFKFYWFDIEKDAVSQSCADCCEDQLAEWFAQKIKEINDKEFFAEVYVSNGLLVDASGERKVRKVNITTDDPDKKRIDSKIEEILKTQPENTITLKLNKGNGEVKIRHTKTGIVEEYGHSKCNKTWDDVVEYT
ncbi:MAG: hypothetical protein NC079_09445 [Clostridium sp.]|nr:hypothetical protein [Acetatifactor muris]MCM1527575.1 hypothetical protein [Bacteroides sp.]MCM1563816.1 hypothetical protein [Clostridium sp.]